MRLAQARGGPATSLYVHAPFCSRRCPYCDFAVVVRRNPDAGAWATALRTELELSEREGEIPLALLETVFVGGGTPSLFGAHAMHALRELLDPYWPDGGVREWTSEANPESLTQDVARGWLDAGVQRLSLGVQTFDQAALRWMGRLHGPEGARAAVEAARSAGFDNINVDLIFALPAHLGRSLSRDLDAVLELDIDHVSLYGLTVEPNTPLGRRVSAGLEKPVEEAHYADEYLLASERLSKAGFDHYEVSNFARPGRTAIHNARYWDGTSYLGLGTGSHSYRHPVRRWNVRSLDEYLQALTQGRIPMAGKEVLDDAQWNLETVWLGLRTSQGIACSDLSKAALELAAEWQTRGLAVEGTDRVRLTPRGWLVLDELALAMDGVSETAGGGLAVPGGLRYT